MDDKQINQKTHNNTTKNKKYSTKPPPNKLKITRTTLARNQNRKQKKYEKTQKGAIKVLLHTKNKIAKKQQRKKEIKTKHKRKTP